MRDFKLMVFDVDGCLTTGHVVVGGKEEQFIFNVQDGLGIQLLDAVGIKYIAISGKYAPSVEERLLGLGFERYFGGVVDKLSLLKNYCNINGVGLEEVVYMGDDLIDLPCMKAVGYSIAPANAVDDVAAVADAICTKNGGEGAAREAVSRVFTLIGVDMAKVYLDRMPNCANT